MEKFTIDELKKLCFKWQERLRLSHWRIGIRICSADAMPLQDVQATSEISLTTECALISILRAEDRPDTPFEQDMEVSLVHELLHIPMEYIASPEKNSLEYVHMEAFLESTARLLVELSR